MQEKVSILLVEDDVNISTLLGEFFTLYNYEVNHVNNPLKALEVLEKETFDLILLDEVMPQMLGSEFLVRIKAKPQVCQIPVIMITSLQNDDHQVSVLKDGADDYIQKPFRFNVLQARIESVLRKNKQSCPIEIEIPEGADPASISPKETEVLALIIKGYNNNRIAKELFISESTVSNHIHSILNKLNAESRTQAAIIALKSNLF